MKRTILFIYFLILSLYISANFIWYPYLTNQGDTYATINFKTLDKNIQVKLYENNVLIQIHKNIQNGIVNLKVKNLKPNTKYAYEIITDDDYYKGIFKTKNKQEKSLKFVVYGDTRYYYKYHRMIIEKIIKEKPEFVINVGDMVENGNEMKYWNNFFYTIRGLNTFYYPVLGNHEKNSKIYYEAFDLPEGGGDYNKRWYSFSYGKYHFIILDSTIPTKSQIFKSQTIWLKKDLEKNKNKIISVIYHYPFWNNSIYIWRKQEKKLEDTWRPIFEKYNVKLIFNGHVHGYERFEKNNIIYITTGAGGAPFDKGTKNKYVPYTKKIVYGILEYVLVEASDKDIKITVKAVGESKNFSMKDIKPVNKIIDYVELK
ncbi:MULTISPECIES: metallophosphoesterase family protein [unclassified Marinitoga]|uniref:metallophosphoesterase family protein n=1 Tax=unclassified Marinitoga TaxID=2640159 RepID=UPI0006417342|nr:MULTISPECIES: metallophosphoesterase [unclassified Marinitoga]KLO25146.1 hypothetical protein X274_00190 [Marinitoga sp. 1155]NUU98745.1 hypothetical protein [Marinitoga sp. 1154]